MIFEATMKEAAKMKECHNNIMIIHDSDKYYNRVQLV